MDNSLYTFRFEDFRIVSIKFDLKTVKQPKPTRKTVDVSEFGVDIDIFEFASADGGTISLSDVAYDPTDPSQTTLQDAVKNQTKLNGSITSGLLFWINSTSYLHVGTSGHILVTTCLKVDADRNVVARTSFDGKVSGAFMYLT